MSRDRRSANRSAWASAEALGHELAEDDREQARSSGHDDQGQRARPTCRATPARCPRAAVSRLAVRLTAAKADARKPMKVRPIWVTARNRPGCATEPLDAAGAAVALVDELVDARPADGHERDLGGDEDRLEQGQEDDDEELGRRLSIAGGRPGVRAASGGFGLAARGSAPERRPRACPAGTSRVTTAPAPVFAPSPISTGATSIVSTPMNAPSPMVVGCLRVPS